ncbi:hypothetical protein [Sulfurivermis fontis]|uniref:hypothetical protein n=1 Tax=Sulfurivermis fontis TaxID=1972068 RepID=UPI000FDCB7FD|nr:hypothetical protein [Sulfurivermis fontis]
MRNMRSLALLWLSMLWCGAALAEQYKDWRKSGTTADKVEQMIKTLPSTSHVMVEVGARYQNLYWAGKLGQWEFAQYQVEEIVKLIEMLQISSPKRAATAQVFLDQGMVEFDKAIASQDWETFLHAFRTMRAQCMICHHDNDHGFIVPPEHPVTAPSVVLNLPQR